MVCNVFNVNISSQDKHDYCYAIYTEKLKFKRELKMETLTLNKNLRMPVLDGMFIFLKVFDSYLI